VREITPYKYLVRKPEVKRPLRIHENRRKDNFKMDL
jgi:hypothetical protein